MNKINRIRRKLEQGKKKSIYDDVCINDNLTFHRTGANTTSFQDKQQNTLSVFPLITLCNSRDASTDHSERSRNTETAPLNCSWVNDRRVKQSPFCENAKKRGKSSHIKQSYSQITTKALNPTVRINWLNERTLKSLSERQNTEQFNITRTPQTVIIITESESLELARTSFRGKIVKRPSLIRRAYATVEKRLSPTRKQSISAWETFDEDRLL